MECVNDGSIWEYGCCTIHDEYLRIIAEALARASVLHYREALYYFCEGCHIDTFIKAAENYNIPVLCQQPHSLCLETDPSKRLSIIFKYMCNEVDIETVYFWIWLQLDEKFDSDNDDDDDDNDDWEKDLRVKDKQWLNGVIKNMQKPDDQKVKFKDLITLTWDELRKLVLEIEDPNWVFDHEKNTFKYRVLPHVPIKLDQQINGLSYLDKIENICNPNLF